MKRKRVLLPLAFLLLLIMLLPLYGCGGNEEGEQLQEEPESEEVTIDEFFKKAEGIEDYSYDFVISDGSTGTLIEGRMWIKGRKQRLEMDSEGGKDVQIIDYEADKAYSYMPEQQMALK